MKFGENSLRKWALLACHAAACQCCTKAWEFRAPALPNETCASTTWSRDEPGTMQERPEEWCAMPGQSQSGLGLLTGMERGSKSNWCFKWQWGAASSQEQGWFSSPDESSLVGRLIFVCLSLSPHLNHFLVRLQCCANLSFPIILVHFASAPCVSADL